MIDLDQFVKQAEKMNDYCVTNPQGSLVTASEKFMAE